MDIKYVKAEGTQGKKFAQVAVMVEELRKAKEPVAFRTLCEHAGVKYDQDVQAAFFALEIVGVVDRYTFVGESSTRKQSAYALTEVAAANPTKATSSASKGSSSRKPAAAKKAAAKAA